MCVFFDAVCIACSMSYMWEKRISDMCFAGAISVDRTCRGLVWAVRANPSELYSFSIPQQRCSNAHAWFSTLGWYAVSSRKFRSAASHREFARTGIHAHLHFPRALEVP